MIYAVAIIIIILINSAALRFQQGMKSIMANKA